MKLNIRGKDKAEILVALYDNAVHAQKILQLQLQDLFASLTYVDAQEILKHRTYVEVVNGVPIDIDFSQEEITVTQYEAHNGLGQMGRPRAEFILRERNLLGSVSPKNTNDRHEAAVNTKQLFLKILTVIVGNEIDVEISKNSWHQYDLASHPIFCKSNEGAINIEKTLKKVGLEYSKEKTQSLNAWPITLTVWFPRSIEELNSVIENIDLLNAQQTSTPTV